MIFNFSRFQIVLRRPVHFIASNSTELVFRYANSNDLLPVVLPTGYKLRPYDETDNQEIKIFFIFVVSHSRREN